MNGGPTRDCFADWRTRPIRRPEPKPDTRPRCVKCGAVLRAGNPYSLCSPHRTGEYELPVWAVALADTDGGSLTGITHVLAVETDETLAEDCHRMLATTDRGEVFRRVILSWWPTLTACAEECGVKFHTFENVISRKNALYKEGRVRINAAIAKKGGEPCANKFPPTSHVSTATSDS